MQSLTDLIDQALFTTTQKGYNPREVDRFMEQLKDECARLAEQYQKLVYENEQLRHGGGR